MFQRVEREASPSVVLLFWRVEFKRRAVTNTLSGWGTGFFVRADGLIVTNKHIVRPWLFTAEARKLSDRACKGGESASCLTLARLEAAAGDKSPEELRTLYDTACEAGEQEACLSLAELLERGDDAEKGRAVMLYEAACEAGQNRACTNLANLAYIGAGGLERSAERSAALNQKACDGGDAVGCTRVAILRALGQGLDKDLEEAREAHAKYCTEDVEEAAERSCETLARLTADEDAVEDGG